MKHVMITVVGRVPPICDPQTMERYESTYGMHTADGGPFGALEREADDEQV
jgi:hypothetical protein